MSRYLRRAAAVTLAFAALAAIGLGVATGTLTITGARQEQWIRQAQQQQIAEVRPIVNAMCDRGSGAPAVSLPDLRVLCREWHMPLRQPARTTAAPSCPPGTTCITGKLLIRDPGSDTPHQVLVEDKNGAPMLWDSVFGLYSGGEPVCVTGLRLQPLACIGGPQGSYGGRAAVTLYLNGRPVTLTARDLAVLAAWAHAREARR